MALENRIKKDLTDQSHASSSRSGSPERLQQLRRAHGLSLEQEGKGKGIMIAEMERKYIQDQQEKWDNDHRESIQAFRDQRGGRTFPSSEIQLGHQKERLQGGADEQEAQRFLHNLSPEDSQAYQQYRNGTNNPRGEAIYQRWSEIYTGVSWRRQQEIYMEVDRKVEQALAQEREKEQKLQDYNRQWNARQQTEGQTSRQQTEEETSQQQTRRQG